MGPMSGGFTRRAGGTPQLDFNSDQMIQKFLQDINRANPFLVFAGSLIPNDVHSSSMTTSRAIVFELPLRELIALTYFSTHRDKVHTPCTSTWQIRLAAMYCVYCGRFKLPSPPRSVTFSEHSFIVGRRNLRHSFTRVLFRLSVADTKR